MNKENLSSTAEQLSRKERIEYLLNILKVDLPTAGVVGYHGTSLEALESLIGNGNLPGKTRSAGPSPPGAIHFFPTQATLEDHPSRKLFYQTAEIAIQAAEFYANLSAAIHYFLKKFGLDISSAEHWSAALMFVTGDFGTGENSPEAYYSQYAQLLGVSEERIDEVISEAQSRRGVICALSEATKNAFTPILKGDDFEDVFIICPNGLPLSFLVGLRPLGESEKKFFQKLQAEV